MVSRPSPYFNPAGKSPPIECDSQKAKPAHEHSMTSCLLSPQLIILARS